MKFNLILQSTIASMLFMDTASAGNREDKYIICSIVCDSSHKRPSYVLSESYPNLFSLWDDTAAIVQIVSRYSSLTSDQVLAKLVERKTINFKNLKSVNVVSKEAALRLGNGTWVMTSDSNSDKRPVYKLQSGEYNLYRFSPAVVLGDLCLVGYSVAMDGVYYYIYIMIYMKEDGIWKAFKIIHAKFS